MSHGPRCCAYRLLARPRSVFIVQSRDTTSFIGVNRFWMLQIKNESEKDYCPFDKWLSWHVQMRIRQGASEGNIWCQKKKIKNNTTEQWQTQALTLAMQKIRRKEQVCKCNNIPTLMDSQTLTYIFKYSQLQKNISESNKSYGYFKS